MSPFEDELPDEPLPSLEPPKGDDPGGDRGESPDDPPPSEGEEEEMQA